jgi:hypothetical protein
MEQDSNKENRAVSEKSDPTVGRIIDLEGPSLVEEVTGRYTDPREHGRGGIGRILVVKDGNLGREVALKELMPREEVASGTDSP